jgi:hypothetical protein
MLGFMLKASIQFIHESSLTFFKNIFDIEVDHKSCRNI